MYDAEEERGNYKSDCVLPNVKHGEGTLQVCGSITYNGVRHLYKITDNFTAPKYKQILIHHAVSVGKLLLVKTSFSSTITTPSTQLG